jgi:hypothetical protein
MPNHKSPAANGNSVPTYLPLSQAARKYNISENVLTRMIQDGRIDAAQLPSGELLVSDDGLNQTKTKEQIIDKKFAALRGQTIGIAEAARKYGISHPTIIRWTRLGYIRKVGQEGQKILLDAADVAYCADVYHSQDGGQGKRILDRDGNPYQHKKSHSS